MTLVQLQTPIAVNVVGGRGWQGPTGRGMCLGWFQPSIDLHLVWIVAMDETGQVWEVENPNVRLRPNVTWGRPAPEQPREEADVRLTIFDP